MVQTNFTLEIESVRGETKRHGKEAIIEVLSFEYGISTGHFQGGANSKRRNYTNVRFTKLIDQSSVMIQQMLATNAKIRQATLRLSKAGGDELIFYKVILKDAFIVSYKIRGEDLPDEFRSHPRDEFEISFRRIEVEYEAQNEKGLKGGGVSFVDDIGTNE
jgi:type VI secretion system secreted protein Hcp